MICPQCKTDPCAIAETFMRDPHLGPYASAAGHEVEGLLLPGWSCAYCRAFNGSAKEARVQCRACGLARSLFDPIVCAEDVSPYWPLGKADDPQVFCVDVAKERQRLRDGVCDAIMAYLVPGSKEIFRATKDACEALRNFEIAHVKTEMGR